MSARVDLVRLAALAAAATPGPWFQPDGYAAVRAGRRPIASTWGDNLYANAPFIAAADPGVVAALVEAVQAAQRAVENIEGDVYLNAIDALDTPKMIESIVAEKRLLDAALAVFGDESPEPFEARPAIEPPGRAGGKQP